MFDKMKLTGWFELQLNMICPFGMHLSGRYVCFFAFQHIGRFIQTIQQTFLENIHAHGDEIDEIK